MQPFRLSAKAVEDLAAIGRFTLKNWGRDQRNKYLTMLDVCFHSISDQPCIGMACDYIRSGYRKYHVGRHLIFYRQFSDHIEIIRILHDSMDLEDDF